MLLAEMSLNVCKKGSFLTMYNSVRIDEIRVEIYLFFTDVSKSLRFSKSYFFLPPNVWS